MNDIYSPVALQYPQKLQIRCSVLSGGISELHWHTDHELLLCLSGSYKVTIDGVPGLLNEGDMDYINQGSTHNIEPQSPDAVLLVINFDVSFTELAFWDEPGIGRVRYSFRIGNGLDKKERPMLYDWSTLIAKRFFERGIGYRLDCAGMLLQLVSFISRHGFWKQVSGPQSEDYNDTYYILSWLGKKENFSRKLTIEDAARELHMSRSSLIRVLKTTAGVSFSEYICSVRVCEAQRALNVMAPEDTITDVGFNCGFSSISSFYRAFKKYTGMSPRQYIQWKENDDNKAYGQVYLSPEESLRELEAFRIRNQYKVE